MPYELAIAARAAGSGGTSSGGVVVVPAAGVPTASVNLSKPPGVCKVRYRACGLVTTNASRPPRRTGSRGIASLTLVFQDVQASGCGVPAGADVDQRAQKPHCLLNLRCEDCRCARRIVVLKRHASIRPRRTPAGWTN